MYVYWLKPLTSPIHDVEQPDDRPTLTFDVNARMGNGGNDIESAIPRQIVAQRIVEGGVSTPFSGDGRPERLWFKHFGQRRLLAGHDAGLQGDLVRYAVPVFPGPVGTEPGGACATTGGLEDDAPPSVAGGYVSILSNYGAEPQWTLSGNVSAVKERLTIMVKGPHGDGGLRGDVNWELPPRLETAQEFTELLASKVWGICSRTWTREIELAPESIFV